MREIEPGEMVVVDGRGLHSFQPFAEPRRRMCIFEYVYFARPDSTLFGRQRLRGAQARSAASWPRSTRCRSRRRHPGARLAASPPPSASRRSPASRSTMGLDPQPLRRPHLHRAPAVDPPLRREAEAQPVRDVLEGKRVVVVDDSHRARHHQPQDRQDDPRRRRARGAPAHLPPPTSGPATTASTRPPRQELIASSHSDRRDRQLHHLRLARVPQLEGLRAAVSGKGYCDACFSGDYPVSFSKPGHQRRQLALVGM